MKIIKPKIHFLSIILLSLWFLVSCGEEIDYPESLTSEQIEGDFGKKFLLNFGSYIQKEDGSFTKQMGKVFFLKTPKGLKVAFYTPTENGFKLLGEPTLVPDTDKATATVPPGEEVPGYILRGKSTYYIFVKKGKIVTKKQV